MKEDDYGSHMLAYRVAKLEEVVAKVATLSDIVTRWDERFSQQGGLLQCNLHKLRINDVEKKLNEITGICVSRTKALLLVEEHEIKIKDIQTELASMRSFMNKAIGALVVISVDGAGRRREQFRQRAVTRCNVEHVTRCQQMHEAARGGLPGPPGE